MMNIGVPNVSVMSPILQDVKRSLIVLRLVGLSMIRQDVLFVTVPNADRYNTALHPVELLKIIMDVLNVAVMVLLQNVLKLYVIIHVIILKMSMDVLLVNALVCVLKELCLVMYPVNSCSTLLRIV